MSFHCLVIDAGHTRTKFAHCELRKPGDLPDVVNDLALLRETPPDWGTIQSWFADRQPESVVVTGTNLTRAKAVLLDWPTQLPAPVLLEHKQRLPITIDVDFPEKVGMDRLLNAIAANAIRNSRSPVICVDTGTAITIDIVGHDGTFRGGAILPGILLGAKSLHRETTTLPEIDVWKLLAEKPDLLGRNTEAAIASGLYWGHLGAVKELVLRYSDMLYETEGPPLVLLTGGAASILQPYLPTARHFPSLSLQGLALAAAQIPKLNVTAEDFGSGV